MSDRPSIMNDSHSRIVLLQEETIKKIRELMKGERLGSRKLTTQEKIENYMKLTPDDFMAMEQKYGPDKVKEYRFEMDSLIKKSDQVTMRKYGLEDLNANL